MALEVLSEFVLVALILHRGAITEVRSLDVLKRTCCLTFV